LRFGAAFFFEPPFRFAALRFGAAFFFEPPFRFAALRLVAITKTDVCLFFYSNTKQNYTN
jgi:hypothetical protein